MGPDPTRRTQEVATVCAGGGAFGWLPLTTIGFTLLLQTRGNHEPHFLNGPSLCLGQSFPGTVELL